ncbi:MAG TPA: hypothetical protein PK788_07995, partial [Gemmatimonadaceae bacterium]|nr:hypothetical protein [Gemmatimonadaceae bacterium]
RQGQIETGVCVLAALPEGADPLPAAAVEAGAVEAGTHSGRSAISDNRRAPYPGGEKTEEAFEAAESVAASLNADSAAPGADSAATPAASKAPDVDSEWTDADAAVSDAAPDPTQVASDAAQGDHLLSEMAERPESDHMGSPTSEASAAASAAAPAAASVAASVAETAPDTAPSEAAAFPEGARISSRHVVYSARYRWTRKGPERGKWECEVVAEADAPLLTVEAVVQGVQHRSNEPLEVQKLDGDTVRAMIAQAQQQWQKTA